MSLVSYPKGSEWRKWDLHIHTPETKLQNNFTGQSSGEKWDNYIKKINSTDLSVIAPTNYFCIDGYKKLLKIKGENRFDNVDLILPNIEFRIFQPNKEDDNINVHIIFNSIDQVSIKNIKDFLGRLELVRAQYPNSKYCNPDDLNEIGYKNALVTFEELKRQLNKDFVPLQDYIFGSNCRGHGHFRPSEGEGRGSTLAIEIDQFSHFVYGNKDDIDFFLDKNAQRYKGSVPKPVFRGSDAHRLDKIGDKFNWIKADPTFEGLKQTVYEPEARSKIQDEKPSISKVHFSNIQFDSEELFDDSSVKFKNNQIELNPNLVTVIGGRGTGKSLLLDAMAKTFNKVNENDRASDIQLSENSYSVNYRKVDGEDQQYNITDQNNLNYLHIHQGEVKETVIKPSYLSDEIKQMLNIDDDITEQPFETFLIELNSRIWSKREWFKHTDEDDNLINTEAFNRSKIDEYEDLIKTLQTEENKALINEYRSNNTEIEKLNKKINQIEGFKEQLESNVSSLNSQIKVINQDIPDEDKIPEINIENQRNSADDLYKDLNFQKVTLKEKNEEIKQEFTEQGIKGDISSLLDDLKRYQERIEFHRNKLEEIEQNQRELKAELEKRRDFSDTISRQLEDEVKAIDASWENLKKGKETWNKEQLKILEELLENIDVHGEIVFDKNTFYDSVFSCLDGKKFRKTSSKSPIDRLEDFFNVSDADTYFKLISNEPIIEENGDRITLEELLNIEEFFSADGLRKLPKVLYENNYRNKYLKTISEIEFDDKPPQKLSVGQRGTLYVSIKLATDPFSTPFVFDQPEDDLDNKFIMERLVPIFRKIKKYRQVIIVTHNANLVVNSDAEQIIVADNENEEIDYVSGAIENTSSEGGNTGLMKQGIREHIKEILEGGEEAFLKREQKYDIR